ncbi:MAG: glycosyltransferase WbuB [Bacteroidetes bacterium]|nr:MAG: glycosyltransferase WbuB [Bacteroidota bacterium]
MKKIIYIHQYFRTFEESGAIRSYYLAKKLVEKNCEVHIITAHNQKNYVLEEKEGIKIHRLPIFYDNSLGILARIISFLKFMYQSYRLAKKLLPANLIYATSTPLSVGLVAYFLRKKVDYIFEVRDLWPEVPESLGIIKNKFLLKIIYYYQKKIYQNAKKIIALSPTMKEGIEIRKIDTKVEVVSNFSDTIFFQKNISKNIHHLKILLYTGTLGYANDLIQMLKIALFAQKNQKNEWQFYIVGTGAEKEKLVDFTKKNELKNVIFIDFVDKINIKNLMQKATAVYISFRQNRALEANSPNKFFDALAAAKPIITNTKGWIKDLIEENKCGFYIDSQKPEDFFACDLWHNPHQEEIYGNNARKLAENQFSETILSEKWWKIIEPYL